MPSASNKKENNTSTDAGDPIKQVLTVVDKKVRNLEKRKGKLDGYKEKKEQGDELNADQTEAVSRYETVVQNLEFARELQKQFLSISLEVEKLAKRKARKEKAERQSIEMMRIKELLTLQALLDNMGTEEVRADFEAGTKGAILLSAANLDQLDELYKLISPSREGEISYEEQLTAASEHIVSYLESREKDVAGTTYKDLKELVTRIHECGYFDQTPTEEETETETQAEAEEDTEKEEQQDFVVVQTEDVPEHDSPEVASSLPVEVPQAEDSRLLPQQTQVPVAASVPGPTREEARPEPEYLEESSFYPASVPVPDYSRPSAPRPFNEIVSSVQGSFNFLQDSELDVDSPHNDPAVLAAQPMKKSHQQQHHQQQQQQQHQVVQQQQHQQHPVTQQPQQQHVSEPVYQSSSLLASEQISHVAVSQSQSPMMSQQEPTPLVTGNSQQTDYDTSHQVAASSSLASEQEALEQTAYSMEQTYAQSLMSSHNAGFPGSQQVAPLEPSAPDVPPSIPLPNQQVEGPPGSHYMGAGQPSLNPNAAMFQSMYSQPTTLQPTPMTQSAAEATMASGDKTSFGQMSDQQDFSSAEQFPTQFAGQDQTQGSFGSGQTGFGFRGNNRTGQRGGGGGRGGGRGMSNGFSGGRGGSGGAGGRGGMYNNSRGGGGGYGGNARGGPRGGGSTFQGYPPRSDYRPEGYQGFSNGEPPAGGVKRGGGAGLPRGNTKGNNGGPRGGPRGGMRGGGAPRGGFGNYRQNSGGFKQESAPMDSNAGAI